MNGGSKIIVGKAPGVRTTDRARQGKTRQGLRKITRSGCVSCEGARKTARKIQCLVQYTVHRGTLVVAEKLVRTVA